MYEWHFTGFSVPAFPNTADNKFTVREFQLVPKSTEQNISFDIFDSELYSK